METTDQHSRSYDTVSPSAEALLLMKGLTSIPFAREAAEIWSQPGKYVPDYDNKNLMFWLRVAHLESRYLSIDQLLADLHVKNILELSSGFSFRCLDAVRENDIHYIDTDLPAIIEKKKELVAELKKGLTDVRGKLELLPLNAVDEKQFTETMSHFPEGSVAIVNEGLLMYLNLAEKEKLCAIIHKILKERGGCWITADVYLKSPPGGNIVKMDDKFQEFLELHRIEENNFDSMEAAEAFFGRCGFAVDKEAATDYTKMSVIPYVLKNATPEQLHTLSTTGKIHATWRLKIADD